MMMILHNMTPLSNEMNTMLLSAIPRNHAAKLLIDLLLVSLQELSETREHVKLLGVLWHEHPYMKGSDLCLETCIQFGTLIQKNCAVNLSGKIGSAIESDAFVEAEIVQPLKVYVSGM